jgi:catechol 2,3-dioxygenase-like lactoylglutathione lyase family enzyme
MSPTNLKAKSFDHFTIVVADLEASRQFYVELLGLNEMERPAFDFEGLWFGVGNMMVHLIKTNELTGQPGPRNDDTIKPSRGLHFAFQVSDAFAAADVIRKTGIEIVDGPKQRPDGATQVFVRDPDGYLIELCSL